MWVGNLRASEENILKRKFGYKKEDATGQLKQTMKSFIIRIFHMIKAKKKSYPHNRPWRPIGL
jgi:hypothetical protein